jgi:hypothetical protein
MDITHKTTGRTVWVLREYNPRSGETYTFAFNSEEAMNKWKDTAIEDWLTSPENVEDVQEWLADNPRHTVECDPEFVFNEVSGVSYDCERCSEWELA